MALRKNGVRLGVGMADVFPHGCHLVPGSITEVQDYDEATGAAQSVGGPGDRQARVPVPGLRLDPELEGRQRETVVKILADRMPNPPTGAAFELVEFEGLQVTPWVDNGRCQGKGRCGARMAFSLRATGIKAARPVPKQDAA
jgi:hypothetical protein